MVRGGSAAVAAATTVATVTGDTVREDELWVLRAAFVRGRRRGAGTQCAVRIGSERTVAVLHHGVGDAVDFHRRRRDTLAGEDPVATAVAGEVLSTLAGPRKRGGGERDARRPGNRHGRERDHEEF